MIDVYLTGLIGTVQQLETANASGGGGGGSAPSLQGTAPNPTGVGIAATSSGNPSANFKMNAQEISNAQNASNPDGADQFDVTHSDFTDGQADITIDISNSASDLNAAYAGQSFKASIAFLGYITESSATSFQWSLSVSSSLSAGSASISFPLGSSSASTDQDALTYGTGLGDTQGIGAFGDINWGGGRGGLIFPSDGDTVTFTIGADATNSNGTTSASDLVIKYTFED